MKKKTPIQQKIARVLYEYSSNRITNRSAINKIEKLLDEREAEKLTNHFVIDGVISCPAEMNDEDLTNKFLSFIENQGLASVVI